MRPLVLTGATGFLGRAVLERLERTGTDRPIVALTRRAAPELTERGIDVRVGSLLDGDWLREVVPGEAPIIHMAGRVDFEGAGLRELYALHVESTRTLARAALEAASPRFVTITSSGASAVSRHPRHHTERDPYPAELVARWPYYQSKMMQERLVLDLHRREALPAVVLAPSLLLGPGDVNGSSTDVVADHLARRHAFVPSGGISIVDVRDVAETALAALDRGEVGERYLLGSLNCSFSTFFRVLESCSGVAPPAFTAPRRTAVFGARLIERLAGAGRARAITPAKADMASHFWYVDSSKAARDLGFAPRRPEETIRDTIRFLETAREPLNAG